MRPPVEARLEVDGQCAGSSLGVKPVADARRRPEWSTASGEIGDCGRAPGPCLPSTRRGLSPRAPKGSPERMGGRTVAAPGHLSLRDLRGTASLSLAYGSGSISGRRRCDPGCLLA